MRMRKSFVLIVAALSIAATQLRDLNKSTVADLDKIEHVSPAVAKAIVARRDSLHGYKNWIQVDSVKGVGPKTMVRLQATFMIGGK